MNEHKSIEAVKCWELRVVIVKTETSIPLGEESLSKTVNCWSIKPERIPVIYPTR